MKDEVNVYRYYKKPLKDDTEIEDRLEDKYPLDAVTNNKQLAKDFEKTRNMKLYIKFKDSMSMKEYVAFINKHRGSEIDEESLLITRDPEDESCIIDIYIPHTWLEKTLIEGNGEHILSQCTCSNPLILDSKYIKALTKLGYSQLYKLNNCIADEYDMPDMVIDQLNLFLRMFEYYLNI